MIPIMLLQSSLIFFYYCKKVLESFAGIANADVSHETGIALVRMDNDVSDEVLTKIIEDEGYKVLGIE